MSIHHVESENIPIRLSVAFRISDGKLMAVFSKALGDEKAVVLDLTDKNNWCVLDGASAEGEFYAHAEGSYIPGSPGYFSPVDGGTPPESAEVEDMNAYLGSAIVTDWLSDDDVEEFTKALIEEAQKEST